MTGPGHAAPPASTTSLPRRLVRVWEERATPDEHAAVVSWAAFGLTFGVTRAITYALRRRGGSGGILIKGRQVFSGYWNNEEATKEVFTEDGYFRTGDLGKLDDEGYLSITGRKKEILVTAAGKNVAPAVLEDRLNAHPLVAQSMVVGDKQPFIAALVTLDPEALPGWLELHGRPKDTPLADLAGDPAVLHEIEAAVASANEAVSRAESIRKFKVLPVEWTIEGGQLSLKMGIKRHVLNAEHAADIEALYAK